MSSRFYLALPIKDNGKDNYAMEKESKSGLIRPNTTENGVIIRLGEEVASVEVTEQCMKGPGGTIEPVGREYL